MPDYLPTPSSFATVSAPPEFAPFCCAPSGSSVPPTVRGCPKPSATRRRPRPSTLPSHFQTEISKNRPYDRPPLSTTGRRSARRPVIQAIPRSASGEPTSGHRAAIPSRLPSLFISSEYPIPARLPPARRCSSARAVSCPAPAVRHNRPFSILKNTKSRFVVDITSFSDVASNLEILILEKRASTRRLNPAYSYRLPSFQSRPSG